MMHSPVSYVERLKDTPYLELIKERDRLIQFLQNYEKNEMAGDRSDPAWQRLPMPDVRYQVYFEYLAELCRLMKGKYNRDYIQYGCLMLKVDLDGTREEEIRRYEEDMKQIAEDLDEE